MSDELRTVWSHTRVYGFGMLLHRGAGLILIPVYTHVLPARDFGVYALIVTVTDLVGVLVGAGLANAMARVYFDHELPADRRRVVSTALVIFGALTLVMIGFLDPLSRLAGRLVFGSQDHRALFLLGFGGMLATLLLNIGLSYLRLLKRSWLFLWVSFGRVLLFLSLNILFVVGLGMGVAGILSGTLVAGAVASLGLAGFILKEVGLSFSTRLAREMMTFGAPLIPATLADVALEATDKYFLNWFFSPALVGVYTLGGKIASLLHLWVTAPFGQIWVVRRLETLDRQAGEAQFGRIFTYFLLIVITCGLVLALFGPEILWVAASSDYRSAITVIPVLALCYIVAAPLMELQIGIYRAKRTGLVMAVSLACAAVNVPLNLVLIGRWGIVGASLALLATNVLRAALTAWAGWRVGGAGATFAWTPVVGAVAVAVGCFGLSQAWFGGTVSAFGVVAKVGLVGLFWALIFAARILRVEEGRLLLQVLGSGRARVA